MVDCSTCKGTGQVHGQWDRVPGGRLIRCPICLGAEQVESSPGHSSKSSDTTGSTSPRQSLIGENAPPKQNAEPSRPISTDKEIINDDWVDKYRVGNTVDKTPMLNKRSGTVNIILSIFVIILAAIFSVWIVIDTILAV